MVEDVSESFEADDDFFEDETDFEVEDECSRCKVLKRQRNWIFAMLLVAGVAGIGSKVTRIVSDRDCLTDRTKETAEQMAGAACEPSDYDIRGSLASPFWEKVKYDCGTRSVTCDTDKDWRTECALDKK